MMGIIWRSLRPEILLLLLLAASCSGASHCDQVKAEWSRERSSNQQLSPINRRAAALAFIGRHPDDPEGCFVPSIRSEIAAIELGLVSWTAPSGATYKPQRVMICGAIVGKTLRCVGPELDDTPLSREGEPRATPIPPGLPGLKLSIDPMLKLKLVGTYSANAAELQNGKPPTPLDIQPGQIHADLLIAIFRGTGKGEFAYRKMIWRIAGNSSKTRSLERTTAGVADEEAEVRQPK